MGSDPRFADAATRLGQILASAGVEIVYGGGAVGLMGALADAALAAGGRVVGVLPRGLFSREVAHRGLTELVEVATMHERKRRMAELADAFVALPGGLGTLEELVETASWAQLGIHDRPVAIVDVAGYWRPLAGLLDQAVAAGFLRQDSRDLLIWVDRVDDVLGALAAGPSGSPEARLGADEL